MSEKRENSVLFSLRELREIENDRVTQEQQDAEARVVAEQRAREDSIRRTQEDEARRIREAQDAERALREAEERRIREDQLRLEEAERKHRVEGQMKLEHERLRMEMDHKATALTHQKKPTILIAASVILVLIVGGLGYYVYQQQQEAAKIAAANAVAQLEVDKQLELLKSNLKEQDGLLEQYKGAATEEERKRIEEQIAAKKREAANIEARANEAKGQIKKSGGKKADDGPKKIIDKCAGSTDPLCGM